MTIKELKPVSAPNLQHALVGAINNHLDTVSAAGEVPTIAHVIGIIEVVKLEFLRQQSKAQSTE